MLATTCNAVREMLRADPSITPADRNRILAALRNHGKGDPEPTAPEPPRLVRRAEAARRLAVSLRAVDAWARAGILHKVRLPGRVRAIGLAEADVAAIIRGKTAA